MTSLADVAVRDLDGRDVLIGDVVDRPTILVVPRYYGCLPCRDYLQQVSDRYDEIEALGGAAVGISVGAAHQARWLKDEKGIRFPLLVDPERHLYDAIDLPRKWWVGFNPRGWVNYARAVARGSRQGRIIEPNQLPGLVVLNARADAVSVHRGRALGDYPPLDQVLVELGRAALPAPA
jgi:peroxiredoxin